MDPDTRGAFDAIVSDNWTWDEEKLLRMAAVQYESNQANAYSRHASLMQGDPGDETTYDPEFVVGDVVESTRSFGVDFDTIHAGDRGLVLKYTAGYHWILVEFPGERKYMVNVCDFINVTDKEV